MKISLCGFYGKNNFGDDLMQDCLSDVLSKIGKVSVYSDIETSNIKDGTKCKDYLKSDLIVIGGGGIVSDNFWIFKNGGIDELISSCKRVVFLNVNVYSDLAWNKNFLSKIKSLNADWWVRDSESKKILSSVDINSEILPDVSFYKTNSHIKKTNNKQLILFPNYYAFFKSFTGSSVNDWVLLQRNILVIADYLNWMISFNWNITISFCQYGQVDDRAIGGMIYSLIKDKSKVVWDLSPISWEEKVNLIKKHDFVLSMRYHSTLVAVMNGIPCVDIVHHDKNKFFWKDLQFTNKSLNMYTIDIEQLCKMSDFSKEFSDYLNKARFYCEESKEKWNEFEKKIIK